VLRSPPIGDIGLPLTRTHRAGTSFRRAADRVYFAAVVFGAGLVTLVLTIGAIRWLLDFTTWVALND